MLTLIRGAMIITMSGHFPEPKIMDILIDGDEIIGLGEGLASQGAEIIDGTGHILMPGLVNAHMHTWQSACRGIAANLDLMAYLQKMHLAIAPRYTPEDIHIGTLAGALNQVSSGTTTLGDWCHNNRTSEHTDAAIDALRSAGIRAVFLPGAVRVTDPENPVAPTETGHSHEEISRLVKGPFAQRDQLLTLGLSVFGPQYAPLDVAMAEFRMAAEFDLIISMHSSGGPTRTPDGWDRLGEARLLGPHVNIVHGNALTDELLGRLTEKGVSFTITPEVEMNAGHGHPITGRLVRLGAMPSLGVDIESGIPGDMFTVMRMALAHQRMLDHDSRRANPDRAHRPLTQRDALAWGTIGGARALGLEGSVGSLETGKKADLIMIDTRSLSLWPMHDPYATALQAGPASVTQVMIAGQWKKRSGQLLGGDARIVLDRLAASALRLVPPPTALAS